MRGRRGRSAPAGTCATVPRTCVPRLRAAWAVSGARLGSVAGAPRPPDARQRRSGRPPRCWGVGARGADQEPRTRRAAVASGPIALAPPGCWGASPACERWSTVHNGGCTDMTSDRGAVPASRSARGWRGRHGLGLLFTGLFG